MIKTNKKKWSRIAGLSGIVLGIYLIYLGNKWGILPIGIGIGMLLWKWEKKWW